MTDVLGALPVFGPWLLAVVLILAGSLIADRGRRRLGGLLALLALAAVISGMSMTGAGGLGSL